MFSGLVKCIIQSTKQPIHQITKQPIHQIAQIKSLISVLWCKNGGDNLEMSYIINTFALAKAQYGIAEACTAGGRNNWRGGGIGRRATLRG